MDIHNETKEFIPKTNDMQLEEILLQQAMKENMEYALSLVEILDKFTISELKTFFSNFNNADVYEDFKNFLEFAVNDILEDTSELPRLFWGSIQVKLTVEMAKQYVSLYGKHKDDYTLALYKQLVLSKFIDNVQQIS